MGASLYDSIRGEIVKNQQAYQSADVEVNWALFDSVLIAKLPTEVANYGYTVCIYKSTKSTVWWGFNTNSGISNESGIQCDGFTIRGIDPHYCFYFQLYLDEYATGSVLGATGNDIDGAGALTLSLDSKSNIQYSTAMPSIQYPQFVGIKDNFHINSIVGVLKWYFPQIRNVKGDYQVCDNKEKNAFIYLNYPAFSDKPEIKEYCMTTGGLYRTHKSDYSYSGNGKKEWKALNGNDPSFQGSFSNDFPNYEPELAGKYDTARLFTNDNTLFSKLTGKGYPSQFINFVTHASLIPPEFGGGYNCKGDPWEKDEDKKSTLTPSIQDIMKQEGKTYYLIGQTLEKKKLGYTHRLYVFNGDGNDLKLESGGGGAGTLQMLNGVPCYENKECKWVKTQPPKQDFKFLDAIDDMDTNFPEIRKRLPKKTLVNGKMEPYGAVTINSPDRILNEKFPKCSESVTTPPTKPDPPEGGGGDGGGGGGGEGGGGGTITPPTDRPLPQPIPPACDTGEGFSSEPISSILLLKVPELSPAYQDTYDFDSKDAQANFFKSKDMYELHDYTYLRKENSIKVGLHFDTLHCYNYLMYKNKQGKWFYCFIMNKEYINEGTTRLIIATDVIQTYLFDYVVYSSYVERCHVRRWNGSEPTAEYEPEGLEFGDPLQVETIKTGFKEFKDSYIAVCSNPLGFMPSRQPDAPLEPEPSVVYDASLPYMQKSYDSWASQINGIVLNTHFYYINLDMGGQYGKNFKPFSKSGQVINFLYFPFLERSDVDKALLEIPFDQGHYGTTADSGTAHEKGVNVYKIYGKVDPPVKDIGSFPRYPSLGRSNRRSWLNESKIYQFPYHFITINDYINTPLVIKNQYIPKKYTHQVPVKVHQPLTMTGGYTIFVPEYKGDLNNGANEGMFASAGLDLPTSSSEYAQFMATSKAQYIASQNSGERNEWSNFARGAVTMAGGVFQAGIGALAMGASGGTATMLGAGSMVGAGLYNFGSGIMDMIQSNVQTENRVEQAHALHKDLINAPRNVNMSSSDILQSLSRNRKQVCANRYMIDEYYRNKLCDYWTLYGYKQNKLMVPNTKSRKNFNYIKTMNVNIGGSNMDKQDLDLIKVIYDKGIRFWHQKNSAMFNYDEDNVEV